MFLQCWHWVVVFWYTDGTVWKQGEVSIWRNVQQVIHIAAGLSFGQAALQHSSTSRIWAVWPECCTVLTVSPLCFFPLQYQHAETPRIPEPGGPERPAAGSAALWELWVYHGINIISFPAAGRLADSCNTPSSTDTRSVLLLDQKGKSRLLLKSCWRGTTDWTGGDLTLQQHTCASNYCFWAGIRWFLQIFKFDYFHAYIYLRKTAFIP